MTEDRCPFEGGTWKRCECASEGCVAWIHDHGNGYGHDAAFRGGRALPDVRHVHKVFHCDRIAHHETHPGDEWPEGRVWIDRADVDEAGFGSICPDPGCRGMGHVLVDECADETGGEVAAKYLQGRR